VQEDVSILDDIIKAKPNKSRVFGPIIILICLFIALVAIQFWLDARKPYHAELNWSVFLAIVLIPVIGTVLFSVGKKVGWILNTLYFGFLSSFSILAFFRILFSYPYSYDKINVASIILLIISTLLVVLLCVKNNRRFFKIGFTLFIVSVSIAILLAGLFIYILMTRE